MRKLFCLSDTRDYNLFQSVRVGFSTELDAYNFHKGGNSKMSLRKLLTSLYFTIYRFTG